MTYAAVMSFERVIARETLEESASGNDSSMED